MQNFRVRSRSRSPRREKHQQTSRYRSPERPDDSVPKTAKLLKLSERKIKGTKGQSINILVNHFEILTLPVIPIYHYECSFQSSKSMGEGKLFSQKVAQIIAHPVFTGLAGSDFLFDGVSLGFSTKKFIPTGEERSTTIDLSSNREKPFQVHITIRNKGRLDIKSLADFLIKEKIDLDPTSNPDLKSTIIWLRVLLRKEPATKYFAKPNGSSFFTRAPDTVMSLKSSEDILEAAKGIYQSVQMRFGRLTVNVDTANAVFWRSKKSLIEMGCALAGIQSRSSLDMAAGRNLDDISERLQPLCGLVFRVGHGSEENRKKSRKIMAISRTSAQDTIFEKATPDGASRQISVQEHMLEEYKIKLSYPRLPLAVTRSGMFPLELCQSVEGQFFKDVLEGNQNSEFIKWATAPAFQRKRTIHKNIELLNWQSQEILKTNGIVISPKFLELKARILPAPTPRYASGNEPRPIESGRWNLRGKRLLKPCVLESWGLVFFPAQSMGGSVQNFGNALSSALAAIGISPPRRSPEVLLGNPHGDIEKICIDIMSKASNAFRAKPNLLIFILPARSERVYRAIKNICEAKLGVPSQVMCWDKAGRPRGQDQYLANVAIKINVKLQGVNHLIDEEMFAKRRTMLMGADVSHPNAAQMRKNPPPPSFSAVVGTWDKACCNYTAVASCQTASTQLIKDFPAMSEELLRRYKLKNNELLPEQILFFRDGLSESEFAQIMADEVEPLITLCKKLGGSQRPRVTAIVAIKRHHTRLFPGQNVRADKNGNVMPGTVVENSSGHDIFLVAHPGLQGTVRPTRYVVLKDENSLNSDQFQRIVNNLCWSYARATTAVSLVPPVFYADQACARAKLHIRRMQDGTLMLAPPQGNVKYSMYWQ